MKKKLKKKTFLGRNAENDNLILEGCFILLRRLAVLCESNLVRAPYPTEQWGKVSYSGQLNK